MNAQTPIVVLCVLVAFVYLVRPLWRRWLARRSAGGAAVVLPADRAAGAACAACKGCAGSSGACH